MSAYEIIELERTSSVTKQPTSPTARQPPSSSAFSICEREILRQRYECDQKACGCGPVITVELTEHRLIQRRQDHLCGCETDRVDSMVFLSDISHMRSNAKGASFKTCPGGASTCYLLFMCPWLLPFCCIRSYFLQDRVYPISVSGAFGTEIFYCSQYEVAYALADIPAVSLQTKLSENPVQSRTNNNRHDGSISSGF